MIYALVDMGSNSIRLKVYKCNNHQVKLLFGNKIQAGLVGYITNGIMTKKGINKACNVLNKFKNIVENFDIDGFFVFATASLRNIRNTSDVVDSIKEKTGIKVDVITGKDEAMYDFIGATRVVSASDGVLVDIGGGSTELVSFENNVPLETISIPIGSLNLYHNCVEDIIPTKKERKFMEDMVTESLNYLQDINIKPYKIICGVGGTVRATNKLNNSIFDLPESNNCINVKDIKKILRVITSDSKESLNTILQVVPDRIHTIVPGLIILNTLARHFESEIITVSDYGAREGYLYSKILGERRYNV